MSSEDSTQVGYGEINVAAMFPVAELQTGLTRDVSLISNLGDNPQIRRKSIAPAVTHDVRKTHSS